MESLGRGGGLAFVGGNTGREVCVQGTTAGSAALKIRMREGERDVPTFSVKVAPVQTIGIHAMIVRNEDETPIEYGEIAKMIKTANDIYAQVCMRFYLASIVMTNLPDAFYITRTNTPEAGFEGCHPSGDVGQSKLVTTSYIGPMTVSFQGVMVAEIPCEDEIPPSGYFATTNFTGFRSHTCYDDNGKPGAGAGYSYPIKPGNRWTVDDAGGGLYPNWSSGRLEWKIPIGWGRLQSDLDQFGRVKEAEYERYGVKNSRPLLIGGSTDKYKQVFTIDADGTSKVEKFGHWLSRGHYCKIILDGVQKKWNHWF